MNGIIIIAGPTASGKTAVAAALARRIGGEIISADSRQVYRYLDVGTNKTGSWDAARGARIVEGVPQYLTDLIEPTEVFSAGDFVTRAEECIASLRRAGKAPIIAGGTGLYIKALVDGLAPLPPQDPGLRKELLGELKARGAEYLFERLHAVDPAAAEKNHGNPQRLLRALEVYELTGIPISTWHAKTEPSRETFLQFGIRWPREALYRSIDRRAADMLRSGMISETERLLARGVPEDAPALQSLGYRDVIAHLKSGLSYEKTEESLRQDTRRYAKRQMTWFRKDGRIRWIDADARSFEPEAVAESISKMTENMV